MEKWYETGELMFEGDYVDGKQQGEWPLYFESGKLREKRTYDRDMSVGNWYFYNEKWKNNCRNNTGKVE